MVDLGRQKAFDFSCSAISSQMRIREKSRPRDQMGLGPWHPGSPVGSIFTKPKFIKTAPKS